MGERQILLIDLERCIGCQTCTIACKSEHGFDKGSGIRVETIETVNTGKKVTGFSEFSMYFQPVTCMQCEQPACLDACTEEAITKRSDGIVLIDAENCTGCEACVSSCPYDALFYDEYKNIVRKCSFCHERLTGLSLFAPCAVLKKQFIGGIMMILKARCQNLLLNGMPIR